MALGVDNAAYAATGDAEVPVTKCKPQQVLKEQVAGAEEQTCGWWRLRPRSLQGFRTAKWALFWLCWAGALQGMVVNGFVNVVITTIERRFGMRSRETGFVAGGYDIASFLCLVPVSYLGGRPGASKPRWLGWGVLLMGLGSLMFAVPHFVAGPLRDAQRDHLAMCSHSANFSSHEEEMCGTRTVTQPLQGRAVWFFLAAQLLHGAGAAPLFTLGVTYIDENVSKKMSSVYLGVYYTMTILGPAVGFVMGGQLLRLYTDALVVDPAQLGLTPESNVWVGAWWIGFLISAVLCVFVAVPLLAFPASLPGASELQAQRVSEAHHVTRKDEGAAREQQDSTASKLRELPRALRRLLANPTFFFLNLAGATEGLLIAGFAAFLPKLIESQFAVNATLAALLMGAVTVPAGGGGTFLGGYLVKRLNLSCAGIIKLCALSALVANVFTLGFFLSCPNVPFAGVTVPYSNTSTSLSLNTTTSLVSVCNQNCGCSEHNFDPVCGADRVMYYSPCFAGCSREARRGDAKVYSQCTCISAANVTLAGEESMEATNQMCPSSCRFLWPFIALVFCTMVFTFLSTMPALSATLRCVEDSQRSFALGIQWIKVRVVGTIPAPIIFGTLIDESCILWQQPEECSSSDEHGACRLYDNFRMSWYMALLAFGVKLCSVVFYSLALWLYTPPPPAESQTTPRPDSCTDISLVQSPSTDTSLGNGHVGSKTTTQLELY